MPSLSSSRTNKICEWVFILICAACTIYFSQFAITTDNQWAESDVAEVAPPATVECRPNTINFYVLNFVGPLIWICIIIFNTLLISRYHGSDKDKLFKEALLKSEILLRSAAMSILWTGLTTEAMKCYVPRKRPCYHAMVADKGNTIDATKAFPSGHTSYAFSVFFLLTLYLMHSMLNARRIMKGVARDGDKEKTNENKRLQMEKVIHVFNGDSYLCLPLFLRLRGCQIIGLFVAIFPAVISLVIGCTRITDFRHTYSDVMSGAFIGISYASLSFVYYKSEFYDGYRYDVKKIFTNEVEEERNSGRMC